MTDSHLELSFVCEDSFGSKVIKWGTHSNYSHVDIITPDGYRIGARTDHPVMWDRYGPTNPVTLYPLGKAGVEKRPMDYAVFSRDDRLIIPCLATNADYAYCWLLDQLGKPYDATGLVRTFFFHDLNWREDDTKWWCSELACVFVEKAGFPIARCPANRMAPNDTYLYAGCFAVA